MFSKQLLSSANRYPFFINSARVQSTLTAGTTTINIPKPTNTAQNDLMIAVMAAGNTVNTRTWTGPSGWSEVLDQNAFPCLAVYYKVAGASEGANYSFSVNSGTSSGLAGGIVTYRQGKYDTIGASVTTGANPLVIASITVAQSNSILLAIGARNAASVTMGTPTGMTARLTDNDSTAPSFIVCEQRVDVGSTGTRSMTAGSTTGAGGILLAINPS